MKAPITKAQADRLISAVAGQPWPAAVVDLAAFDHNLERLLSPARAAQKNVRLASKSLRVVRLLERAFGLGAPTLSGLMVYSVEEAARLAQRGFRDLLLGYPTSRPSDARLLADLAAGPARVVAMVDDLDQLPILVQAARDRGARIPLAIDLDVSTRPAGLLHFGVRRSPLHDPTQAAALARAIHGHAELELVGLMGYEAQLAGLAAQDPRQGALGPLLAWFQALGRPEILAQRSAAKAAIEAEVGPLRLVNGGGTGSVDWSSLDGSLSEVTIGSGLLAPHLFDHYPGLELQPALHFVLAVTRRPGPGLVTCQGGGYIASGAAGPDRLPEVSWPPGLTLLPREGAGEVQTPLRVPAELRLGIGDPVLLRPAKAGELAERFTHYTLVDAQGRGEVVPTYRGEGWAFG